MRISKDKLLFLISAVLVYLVGQFFRGVWFKTPGCRTIQSGPVSYCESQYAHTLGWPLVEIGTVLFIAALLYILSNPIGGKRLLKFNYFALPIAVIAFFFVHILFPDSGFAPLDPLRIIDFIGYWLYLPLSVLIVLASYLPARKK